jgi:hypothetical protein
MNGELEEWLCISIFALNRIRMEKSLPGESWPKSMLASHKYTIDLQKRGMIYSVQEKNSSSSISASPIGGLSDEATMGVMVAFAVMMILDVAHG